MKRLIVMENHSRTTSLFLQYPALAPAALTSALLSLKCIFTSQAIGFLRVCSRTFAAPEDYQIEPRASDCNEEEEESSSSSYPPRSKFQRLHLLQRLLHIQRNDTENIPHFMITCLFHALAMGSSSCSTDNLREAKWLYGMYVVFRILHTMTYLMSVQPHRSLCYMGAISCQLILLGRLLEKLLLAPVFLDGIIIPPLIEDGSNSSDMVSLPIILLTPLLLQGVYYMVNSPRLVLRLLWPVTAPPSQHPNSNNI